MNDPVPQSWRWGAVVALAALTIVRVETAPWVLNIAVLGLAGLALLPVVGWLRTLWFAPLPAAAVAGYVTATLLHRGQAVTLAFAAATAAGVLVAAALAAATQAVRRPLRPWVSLLVAVGVSGILLPRAGSAPSGPPLLFGIDLSGGRALAIVALLFLAAGLWVVTNLASSRAGREIATAGTSAELAVRAGAAPRDAWLRAGIVSGVLSGWVGLLLAIKLQGIPGASQLGPAVAVAWLAVPILGGVAWPSGAVAGAVAIGGLTALLHVGEPAVAAVALLAGALLGDRGLVGEVARLRSRPQ